MLLKTWKLCCSLFRENPKLPRFKKPSTQNSNCATDNLRSGATKSEHNELSSLNRSLIYCYNFLLVDRICYIINIYVQVCFKRRINFTSWMFSAGVWVTKRGWITSLACPIALCKDSPLVRHLLTSWQPSRLIHLHIQFYKIKYERSTCWM